MIHVASLGMVPVTIRPPHPQNISTTLPTVKMISEVSKSVAILTSAAIIKILKTKVGNHSHNMKCLIVGFTNILLYYITIFMKKTRR